MPFTSTTRKELAAWLVTVAGGVAVFYVASHVTITAQESPGPFYLARTISVPNERGELAEFKREILARRSDGASVVIQTVGPLAAAHTTREIRFIDGNAVTAFDSIQGKSTWPQASDQDLRLEPTWDTKNPVDCGAAFGAITQDDGKHPRVLGRTQTKGQNVTIIESVQGGYRTTNWSAASLGCENLYYKSESIQADGSLRLELESKTSELVIGEPDSRLFQVDATYLEMSPSTAHAQILKKLGLAFPPDQLSQLAREDQQADHRYFARPRGLPRSKQ